MENLVSVKSRALLTLLPVKYALYFSKYKTEGHSEENKLDIYKEDGECEGRVPNLNASFFFVYLFLKQ
jgi:hypothetical protein